MTFAADQERLCPESNEDVMTSCFFVMSLNMIYGVCIGGVGRVIEEANFAFFMWFVYSFVDGNIFCL